MTYFRLARIMMNCCVGLGPKWRRILISRWLPPKWKQFISRRCFNGLPPDSYVSPAAAAGSHPRGGSKADLGQSKSIPPSIGLAETPRIPDAWTERVCKGIKWQQKDS